MSDEVPWVPETAVGCAIGIHARQYTFQYLGIARALSVGCLNRGSDATNELRGSEEATDDCSAGIVKEILTVLWLVAGGAMLVFTVFLAVLVIAGAAFRFGPANLRRRSRAVFAASSIMVTVVALVLLVPDSFHAQGDAARRSSIGTARTADIGRQQSAVIYPAVPGLPLRYANGGSSGDGVNGSKARTLVLYDSTGAAAGPTEVDATKLVNLVSHFGAWTAHPVDTYQAGELAAYDAAFYLGATRTSALPVTFLDDVLGARHPVMWINDNIEQLEARNLAGWTRRYGFVSQGLDTAQFTNVRYKGASLPMHQVSENGLVHITVTDPTKATVLATAERADGTSLPWAVRSNNVIYVSENPLPYIAYDNDRYLAFADLLFEAVRPDALTRHRALVRLEDVNPTTDPVKLRAVVDYLYSRGVPVSIGVYPIYRDPNGVGGYGVDATIRLSDRPAVVAALRYATTHGGSLVLHGYTHQYSTKNNPNNAQSGQDAEFYLCHLDDLGHYQLDGPVTEDSQSWAAGRIDAALGELAKAGLPKPRMFEFPHYMASPVDYVAAGKRFDYRYERSLYFPGLLSGRPVNDALRGWQFFPYTVRDIYGATVIPENMDYVASTGDSVPDLLDRARSNLVVRDGVASFFYHPFLGVGELPRLVDGIRSLGYTFVSAGDLAASP